MKKVSTSGLAFQDIRSDDRFYIDKSLLIKDILDTDDRGVYLYTRPRRFGKTVNITMLDAFFNIEIVLVCVVFGLVVSWAVGYLMARKSNEVFGMVNGDILGATNEIARLFVVFFMALAVSVFVW